MNQKTVELMLGHQGIKRIIERYSQPVVVDPSFRASDATVPMTKSWRGCASKDVRKKTTPAIPQNSCHVTRAKGLMPEEQKLDRQLHGCVGEIA